MKYNVSNKLEVVDFTGLFLANIGALLKISSLKLVYYITKNKEQEEIIMAVVYAFLADGLEEVECLATADVLIRAGVKVKLVSITGKKEVKGAHGFGIHADTLLHEIDPMKADLLFLPGGMPGTKNLMACKPLCDALVQSDAAGKRLAAICAAPSILGQLGLLKDRKATCYPGFEDALTGAKLTGAGVVTDGNITTARGLGYALDLGIELASLLVDRPVALQVKDSIQYDQV